MFRNSVLVVVLLSLFSSISLAAADSSAEFEKKFAQAQNLALKGEIEQAITAYTSLIKLNPQHPEIYNNLAALYLKQKNTKQAKHILEQGIYAHKGYGALYESLTAINVAMAREAYSKALQIDLKPADIAITSLSLNDNKPDRKKSTIVISKTNNPTENKKVLDVKPDVKSKSMVKAKPLGEVKRTSVANKLKQIPVKREKNTEAIETILLAWSAAWSAQATDVYLSFYHSHYKPSNGLSRKGWVQSRRLKLKKPKWIKVGLSNFNIERNDGRQAVVKFKQSYQSNTYQDLSSKRMVLLYTESGWRIFQEKSI